MFLKATEFINTINLFIKVKHKNKLFFALCPFHKEKTPSFFINQIKQKYYCFGCKSHGNIIDFIMKYKSINSAMAISWLKKKHNLINFSNSKDFNSLNSITKEYAKILKNEYRKKKNIYNIFHKRNISYKSIVKFKIGFAPNSWYYLIHRAKDLHLQEKDLIEGGLIKKNKTSCYNRFKNKIMFPIRNTNGNTIGFGGKAIYKEKPKYINSPETKFFKKKYILYGIYECIKASYRSDTVIIVEGYIDLITLHQIKITNSVATLGTTFTQNHFEQLKKTYKNIIFCFDSDIAGKTASIKIAYTSLNLLNDNISIYFAELPENQDPDSYINKCGKKAFLKIIKKATYIIDYIYKNINFNIDKIKDFIKLRFKIKNLIKKIIDPIIKKIIYKKFLKKIIFTQKKTGNYINKTLNLEQKACTFLIKNRKLKNLINIKILINLNKFIKSGISALIELTILFKRYPKIHFKYIEKLMLNKLFISNNYIFILNKMSENVLHNEFLSIINKIYNVHLDTKHIFK